MSRLLPSNEVLTVTYVAVLKIIAAELDHPLGAVHIGKRTSGPAVFHEGAQGNNGTRCVCDLWSPNWQECQARTAMTALLAPLDLGKGPA